MKNKKFILFAILFLPTTFWLFLEMSTINSHKLPHYGPKIATGKDTTYYSIISQFKNLPSHTNNLSGLQTINLDTINFPLFAVGFIKQSYKVDNYRLAGLSEYVQFKKEKIKEIPFIIVTECDYNGACVREFEQLHIQAPNVQNLYWETRSFDSLNKAYFKAKPIYIDYSFFVLIDVNRNIRGYYDMRYVSEIKRLIEEYQHLRLKEEKKNLLNQNKIESK